MRKWVRWTGCFFVVLAVLVAGCSSAAPPDSPTALSRQVAGASAPASSGAVAAAGATDADLLASFEKRPLQLPAPRADQSCPASSWQLVQRLVPDRPQWSAYFAFGGGPIYAIVYGTEATGHLSMGLLRGGGVQVVWLASPNYQHPALIRGGQIGESSPIRFVEGTNKSSTPSLHFSAGEAKSATTDSGWRSQPSTIEVTDPGCYAFQIDGVGLSELVTFEVTT